MTRRFTASSLVFSFLCLAIFVPGCQTDLTSLVGSGTKAAPPAFNPIPGNFSDTLDVVLSSTDPGATIYYTLDATSPSEVHGQAYTSPIHLTATTTITAIAYKEGMLPSDIVQATYTHVGIRTTPDPNQDAIYTITTTKTGRGSLLITPYQTAFAPGSSVQVTAIPEVGWAFDHWEGDAAGTANPVSIVTDASKTVRAVFVQSFVPTIVVLNPTIASIPLPAQDQSSAITVSCTVIDSGGTIQSVTADLSQIGGQAAQAMTQGDNNNWTWSGDLIPRSSGLKKITFTAVDTQGPTATSDTYITVKAPHAPPTILNPSVNADYAFYKDIAIEVTVSCDVTASEGTITSVVADLSQIGGSANQVLTLEANSHWTWRGTVTPNVTGTRTITITATDSFNATGMATVTKTVTEPSAAPVVSNPSVTQPLYQNRPADNFTVACTVSDPDGIVAIVTADLSAVDNTMTDNVSLTKSSGSNWRWGPQGVTPTRNGAQTVTIYVTDTFGRVTASSVVANIGGINVTAPAADIDPDVDNTTSLDNVTISWNTVSLDLTDRIIQIWAVQENTTVTFLLADGLTSGSDTIQVNMSKVPPGSYTVRADVIDIDNATGLPVLDNVTGEPVPVVSGMAPGKILIANRYRGWYDLFDMANATSQRLSPISGTIFEGFVRDDEVGYEVAGVGDLDNDSKSECLVFAHNAFQSTGGGRGGAYLIYGNSAFNNTGIPKVVDLNSIPYQNNPNPDVTGTFLWFPMECKRGDPFNALGLPDVSGDQRGDLIIGCPEAGPLLIDFWNDSEESVDFIDQYGKPRTYPAGTGTQEAMHVPPYFNITMRMDEWSDASSVPADVQRTYEYGRDYLPGDHLTCRSYTDRHYVPDAFRVEMYGATGAVLGTIPVTIVTFTVVGTDQIVWMEQPRMTVKDNDTTLVIPVLRTAGEGILTVEYATSAGTATPGTDYDNISDNLTMVDGQTTGYIRIHIRTNPMPTGDLTFHVTLANPTLTNASGTVALGLVADTEVTIVDAQAISPGILEFAAASYDNPVYQPVTVAVLRTGGCVGEAKVTYTINGGAPVELTFADSEVMKTFQVSGQVVKRIYSELTWVQEGNRGAVYLLPSQRLLSHKNGVYDLLKAGAPIEDGHDDQPNPVPDSSGIMVWKTSKGEMDRSQMFTSFSTGRQFGGSLSVLPDITHNNAPELLIAWPNQSIIDMTDPARNARTNAGVVTIFDGAQRWTSIPTQIGCIGCAEFCLGITEAVGNPVRMFSNPAGIGDTPSHISIVGPDNDTRISSPAGLGKYISPDNHSSYVNGDFDNDTRSDMIVASPTETVGGHVNAGAIYLIPGREIVGQRYSQIDLKYFNQTPPNDNGTNVCVMGVKIAGAADNDTVGQIVKPAGDFNGDGLADFMFAQPDYDNGTGRVTIILGKNDLLGDYTTADVGSGKTLQIQALILKGENPGDHFGARICPTYDVNGDGVDDILVAAPDAGVTGKAGCGKVYLVYGKKAIIKKDRTLPAGLDRYVDYDGDDAADSVWPAEDIATTLKGAIFVGEVANGHLQAISSAGDVDGDGVGDFIIGAPYAPVSSHQPNAGKAYLITGRR